MPDIDRRQMLSGMGLGALSLPFLPNILRAQTAAPKRLIFVSSPNGALPVDHWKPNGSGDFNLTSLRSLMQPLERHMSKINIIGEMELESRQAETKSGGHVGMGHILTGRTVNDTGPEQSDYWATGPSVDQVIAEHLGVAALTMATKPRGSNGNSRISYKGANQPVHPIEDPGTAFQSIFGNFTAPPNEQARRRDQQKSVLDVVAKGVGRLRSRLAGDDWMKLDRHLESVRTIESRIDAQEIVQAQCNPSEPGVGDYPTSMRANMDVLVEALACNVTQVATLQNGNGGGAENYSGGLSWPSEGINYPVSQHVAAHDFSDGSNEQRRVEIEKLYYRQWAYFLDKLDAVPEGNGTLLDNCLVVFIKSIGRGHSYRDHLFITAGGLGGAVQTGRYLDRDGEPHNNLLLRLCHLMGMTTLTNFGDSRFCTGTTSL